MEEAVGSEKMIYMTIPHVEITRTREEGVQTRVDTGIYVCDRVKVYSTASDPVLVISRYRRLELDSIKRRDPNA